MICSNFSKLVLHEVHFSMKWFITIDKVKCTACGECVESCPGDVFEIIDACSHPVRLDDCHGCHTCEEVCEVDAVTVKEEE